MKFYFLIIFCYSIWLFDEKISGDSEKDETKDAVNPNKTDALLINANTIPKTGNTTPNSSSNSRASTITVPTKNASANSETKNTKITTPTVSTITTTTKIRFPESKIEGTSVETKGELNDDGGEDDIEPIPNDKTPKKPDTGDTEQNVHAQIDRAPSDSTDEPGSSHFMTYFLMLVCLVIVSYVAFYKRKKLLGLIVEGRRSHADRKNVRYRKLREGATDEENGVQKGNVIY